MNADLGQVKHDVVTVTNKGTTTVTYEWKRVVRGDFIASKKSDFQQRFYCHYVSVLPSDFASPGAS